MDQTCLVEHLLKEVSTEVSARLFQDKHTQSSKMNSHVVGLLFSHDVNLKGQVGRVPQRLLPTNFSTWIELVFTGGGHHQASLSSLCLFFCDSPRQLVSNIYLLPFQIDRDNREAYLDRGLCHLTATVANAEVKPRKGNGALLFPPSALKHKWLHW